ncbi:UNVERIFIED_ORG: hypothetical protein B2H98_08100 [Clostridium botulinum]|uniref:hypothetical protein n=1 Tax=Clostridium sp. VAP23 TaxID=2949981 RepID=UPI000A17441F|nr:hypothetical protein [Clostridium sp. VAP23]
MNIDNDVQINPEILKMISLNSKIQRSALRIYLFMLSMDRPVYQKELTSLAKAAWDEFEDLESFNQGDEKIKCVSDFRAEVICRSIKALIDFNLVKFVKQEGNNKFVEVERDINKIMKKIQK